MFTQWDARPLGLMETDIICFDQRVIEQQLPSAGQVSAGWRLGSYDRSGKVKRIHPCSFAMQIKY